MADFTNNQIKNTYQRVLQHDLSGVVQNGTGSADLGDIHISGSLYHTGSAVISNNLRVLGNVTAQQFIATTVSSSIVYESGSSQFGNSLDDTHTFTGSVYLTGSQSITGSVQLSGTYTHVGSHTHTGGLLHSGSTVADGTYEVKEGVYGAFFANPQTLTKNVTIPANYNSRIFGPITVAAGKTLTVAANAKLEITDI